jgi:hypothetical protein
MLNCGRKPSDEIVELGVVVPADDLLGVVQQRLHQLAALLRLDRKTMPKVVLAIGQVALRLEHQGMCAA